MKYVLILLFAICCNRLMAQEFSGNSSAVKWQQINTDTVKIIFPKASTFVVSPSSAPSGSLAYCV